MSDSTTYKITVCISDEPILTTTINHDSLKASLYDFTYEVDTVVDGQSTTYKDARVTGESKEAPTTPKTISTMSYALGCEGGVKYLEQSIMQKTSDACSDGLSFTDGSIQESAYAILHAVRKAIEGFAKKVFDNPTVFEGSVYADVFPLSTKLGMYYEEQGIPLVLSNDRMNSRAVMLTVDVVDVETGEKVCSGVDTALFVVDVVRAEFGK